MRRKYLLSAIVIAAVFMVVSLSEAKLKAPGSKRLGPLNYITYEEFPLIEWPEGAPEPTKPLMPLLTDWGSDGKPDLLISDGKGRLWVAELSLRRNAAPTLSKVEAITADGEAISTGSSFQPNYVDITGDGRPDLVMSNGKNVIVYENAGTGRYPSFKNWAYLNTAEGTLVLPENVGPRVSVTDWNRDGKLDLLVADFDGAVSVFLNVGSAKRPLYKDAVAAAVDGEPIKKAYRPHVQYMDADNDGIPDLVLAMNWTDIKVFPNREAKGMPRLQKPVQVLGAKGTELNVREVTGDHLFPAFGDYNGDGLVDMIYGNKKDLLHFSAGVRH